MVSFAWRVENHEEEKNKKAVAELEKWKSPNLHSLNNTCSDFPFNFTHILLLLKNNGLSLMSKVVKGYILANYDI
ncbi:conserved hypothetical protein [Ricinus communis]|uniref:Uncharacterized protein n=1 Tax=Ricinus communis TaxID=3988 RepID=B9RCU7_RICCO|nr:conserved hypothetical protein [Ricinus communis]